MFIEILTLLTCDFQAFNKMTFGYQNKTLITYYRISYEMYKKSINKFLNEEIFSVDFST